MINTKTIANEGRRRRGARVGAKIKTLSDLDAIAVVGASLPARTSPKHFDALGLEGKDCPCAPR
jgi:hypothetical protein